MTSADRQDAEPDTRLMLIRHGESQVAVERVIGGPRTCTGLSELGRLQAERLRDRFATEGMPRPELVIASHYARAQETANIVAPALGGSPVEIDPGFGEHDPGPDIDGISYVEYIDRFGTPDWDGDPHVELFAGGETTAQFQLRVGSALSRVVREHRGATIVIFCHGGVIDSVFRRSLNTPPTGAFSLHTLNASISEFACPAAGNVRLERYNDAAHLAGLPAETVRAGR